MIVDLSKIPSTCTFMLTSGSVYGFGCALEETIRGKSIRANAHAPTMQGAIDEAVRKFLS